MRAPRANAYIERWIGGCRRDLLDRTLITNERHLRTVLTAYEKHCNTHRPHRALRQTARQGQGATIELSEADLLAQPVRDIAFLFK
ncbi:integrase core domain-containing protein [Streptomyces sp. NPDC055239]